MTRYNPGYVSISARIGKALKAVCQGVRAFMAKFHYDPPQLLGRRYAKLTNRIGIYVDNPMKMAGAVSQMISWTTPRDDSMRQYFPATKPVLRPMPPPPNSPFIIRSPFHPSNRMGALTQATTPNCIGYA
ncbi:hypothetical protein FRB99_001956 [Tulasnella sp. 403]|nr:hypothetical protein FRB99_001956 [Tulasnella sp. 403]